MLLEALLDDRQNLIVDEAGDGVLHHPFVLGERLADAVEVQRIKGGGRGLGHRALLQSRQRQLRLHDDNDLPDSTA